MMQTKFPSANPRAATLPTYEPGRPIETVARELGFGDLSEIVKLASNENALGPSPKAAEAMHNCVSQMHLYPDGGTHALRTAIAEKLKLRPEEVLPGNGSNELLELLGHVYLGPDVNIVMAEQAFIVYRLIAAACGAEVVSVPMQNFTHDLDAMLAAITDETRIVFIANPNNPTSTMVDQRAIDAFMDAVPAHVLTCFDEAYVELLDDAQQTDALKYVRDGRAVIVLRTFSKSYGLAGLRVGYALAARPIIDLLNRVRQPFNVNAMAQHAAIAALGDDVHIERTRELVRRGIEELVAGFNALSLDYVPATVNFILVRVNKGRTVFEKLMKFGVIVRPMDVYGLPEYVRVSVGTTSENSRFLNALGQVMKDLQSVQVVA
ncbi:MAG: histidinol-phosphate transaminase [Verrucomicrobia bacterium]|nr:histidinol-phosphate transaminase [Verrucomicrobiota bacterium]